jgi:futalosine hydrolase
VLPELELVLSGVGKAAAAGAVARCLQPHHTLVLNIGICGILPGDAFVPGELVLARESVMADEGVRTGERFIPLTELGFAVPGNAGHGIRPSQRIAAAICGRVDRTATIATVSTCSGTDAQAAEVQRLTGASCEAMEGAAAGLSAMRCRCDFAEVRAVSNTTGDRARQRWEIKAAFAGLSRLGASLRASPLADSL